MSSYSWHSKCLR